MWQTSSNNHNVLLKATSNSSLVTQMAREPLIRMMKDDKELVALKVNPSGTPSSPLT
jgi:hypothetical protein